MKGKYPLVEKDGLAWALAKYYQGPLEMDTDLVKKVDVASYSDLLRHPLDLY